MSDDPTRDAVAAAFQALLRGDTSERDRQVERARKILDAQEAIPKVDLSRSEIVARLLVIAEQEVGRPLTAVEQAAIQRDPVGLAQTLLSTAREALEQPAILMEMLHAAAVTSARDVIAHAIQSVCSDGNSDPRVVASDVLSALSAAGFELTRRKEPSLTCPSCGRLRSEAEYGTCSMGGCPCGGDL